MLTESASLRRCRRSRKRLRANRNWNGFVGLKTDGLSSSIPRNWGEIDTSLSVRQQIGDCKRGVPPRQATTQQTRSAMDRIEGQMVEQQRDLDVYLNQLHYDIEHGLQAETTLARYTPIQRQFLVRFQLWFSRPTDADLVLLSRGACVRRWISSKRNENYRFLANTRFQGGESTEGEKLRKAAVDFFCHGHCHSPLRPLRCMCLPSGPLGLWWRLVRISWLTAVKKQKDMGINAHAHPRTPRVRKAIELYKQMRFKQDGGHIHLRQRNHEERTYTDEQYIDVQEYLWKRGKITDLRTKVDLAMGHSMALRSQNRLLAELADMYMAPQAQEGYDGKPVPMLIILLREGKVLYQNLKISVD